MSYYSASDLETLRKQAQEIEKVLAAQQTAREQAYAAQQAALAEQQEQELRAAYVSQQQALAQLPEQLAQAGINGGLTESSLVQLNRTYGNQRADIGSRYAQGQEALRTQKAEADAEASALAAQNRIDYLGAESALIAQAAEQERAAAQQMELARQAAAYQAQQAAQQKAWSNEVAALRSQIGALQGQLANAEKPEAKPVEPKQHKNVKLNSSLVGHTALVR